MVYNILPAFIPIFVAVDAIGVLPIFVGLTQGVPQREKNRIIGQSVMTALCVALGFILLGRVVFSFLGITIADFMIAGGAVLFCLAVIDIVTAGKRRRLPADDLGSVPLGTPLIVGPAVLSTSLMMVSEYGLYPTLIAVLLNVLLAGAVFSVSPALIKILGEAGAKALSKVMALLLAAIAVMMIRKGVLQIVASAG